ncbi:organic cation/carnitine transporter 7-like isoform X2 [Euphorbia lathyris]|uniref:organic cation/carnitine transporter 7-like isoform X2 n=1 Tax=Euphorbia lathyris TaxID=212925 RepID=UPI003313CD9B
MIGQTNKFSDSSSSRNQSNVNLFYTLTHRLCRFFNPPAIILHKNVEEDGDDADTSSFIISRKMEDGEPRYTVDEALLAVGFGKFQYFVLLYSGMGWVSEAMEMMLLSFVGTAVQKEWGLTSHQESLITTVVFLGMLVGAYSWGLVSDKYGRRKGFLVTALVTSGAGFLSSFSPNYAVLLLSRCIVGLGLGGGPVLLSWFLEFVPAPKRGFWMVVFQAFWTVGTIVEAALAWVIMPRLGWRWLLALCSLPTFLLLVFYPITPESPRYFCLKSRENDAFRILEKIAKVNGNPLPAGVLVSDHEIELQKQNLPEDGGNLRSSHEDKDFNNPPSRWKDSNMGMFRSLLTLLSPKLFKTTLLLWVVFFGNAFSYYGLVLLTTELNKGNNNCNPTDKQSDKSGDVNYRDILITSFAVDRLGRKLSMAGMFFICLVFLLPLVVHQHATVTTALLFGARICITGTFTVVYIYAPEIYPTSVRSTGVGVASSMGRIGGMLCPLVAVSLVQGCHQTAAVLLFAGVVFMSGVSVSLFPFETKGKELTESISSTKHEKPNATT